MDVVVAGEERLSSQHLAKDATHGPDVWGGKGRREGGREGGREAGREGEVSERRFFCTFPEIPSKAVEHRQGAR